MKGNIHKRLRDFRGASEALQKVMDKSMAKSDKILSNLYRNWGEIIGEKASTITLNKVTHYKDSTTLHIFCQSAFALEMSFLEPILLEKIAVFFGYRAVHKLRITQRNDR